jgi:hypothetical protein
MYDQQSEGAAEGPRWDSTKEGEEITSGKFA